MSERLAFAVALALSACASPKQPAEPPPAFVQPQPGLGPVRAAIDAGNFARAKTLLEGQKPTAEVLYYRGLVADRLGSTAEAEARYRDALLADPSLAEAAVNLAALLVDARRFAEAAAVARAGLAKRPDVAELALNLAFALGGLGDQSGALTQFRAAARAATDAPTLTVVGHQLRLLRQPAECVTVLDAAIAKADSADARVDRGLCKLALRQAEHATADFRRAVVLDPRLALAHYWLGVRLAAEGNRSDAAAEFDRCLELEPNGPLAAGAREKRRALDSTPRQ
ncbi:MAG: tetratricopeptide repeat protein [Myxococcales bacterium]